MENAVYDIAVLQKLANRLDRQSKTVVVIYTIISASLFSAIFYYAASMGEIVNSYINLAPIKSLGIGLLIGVVIGFIVGQRKSSQLKLSSQLALCQIQIEKNTHFIRKLNDDLYRSA